jgi:hypothetical protein
MRTSKLSAAEIAEMDENKRRQQRDAGLILMGTRDSGVAQLENGVKVKWHTSNQPITTFADDSGIIYEVKAATLPPGKFGLEIDNKLHVFDAEDLMKYLRWA